MPPPELPLELLLMIAHHIRYDHGELRYSDFNSFLQVNTAVSIASSGKKPGSTRPLFFDFLICTAFDRFAIMAYIQRKHASWP
jgi:hypothetical protein